MEFHVIASGSKGNSTLVISNNTTILIDCGISKKRLVSHLEKLKLKLSDIDFLLVTHNHSDHDKNIHFFDKKITYAGMNTVSDLPKENILVSYQEIKLNNLTITPIPISHDAVMPFAYIISGDESLLYMTDTGYVSQKNLKIIKNLSYYVFECNHDIEMLMASSRPDFLKNRILSDVGHLENKYSARIMAECIGDRTKEIVLAHLSEDANTEEKALKAYNTVFKDLEISFNNIKVASQKEVITGGCVNEN